MKTRVSPSVRNQVIEGGTAPPRGAVISDGTSTNGATYLVSRARMSLVVNQYDVVSLPTADDEWRRAHYAQTRTTDKINAGDACYVTRGASDSQRSAVERKLLVTSYVWRRLLVPIAAGTRPWTIRSLRKARFTPIGGC